MSGYETSAALRLVWRPTEGTGEAVEDVRDGEDVFRQLSRLEQFDGWGRGEWRVEEVGR